MYIICIMREEDVSLPETVEALDGKHVRGVTEFCSRRIAVLVKITTMILCSLSFALSLRRCFGRYGDSPADGHRMLSLLYSDIVACEMQTSRPESFARVRISM